MPPSPRRRSCSSSSSSSHTLPLASLREEHRTRPSRSTRPSGYQVDECWAFILLSPACNFALTFRSDWQIFSFHNIFFLKIPFGVVVVSVASIFKSQDKTYVERTVLLFCLFVHWGAIVSHHNSCYLNCWIQKACQRLVSWIFSSFNFLTSSYCIIVEFSIWSAK